MSYETENMELSHDKLPDDAESDVAQAPTAERPNHLLGFVVVGLIAAICFGYTLVIRLHFLSMPFERDEGEYAYIGQQILHGVMPFASAYTMKLPGTAFMYALSELLFGQTTTGVHIGLLINTIAACILLFALVRRIVGTQAGVLSAAFYALLTAPLGILGPMAHASQYVVPFALAGYIFLLKAMERSSPGCYFLSGVFLGLSFLMEQMAVPFILLGLVLPFAACFQDRSLLKARLRGAVLVFVGAAAPYGILCAVLWKAGVFPTFWLWTVVYARAYVEEVGLARAVNNIDYSVHRVFFATYPLLIFAVGGLIALLWSRLSTTNKTAVVGLFIAGAVSTCLDLDFRLHYYITMMPGLAALSAFGIATLIRAPKLRRALKVCLCLVAV